MCRGDFHFIEKANGIKYLYAWLDKHPQEYSVKPSRLMAFMALHTSLW